jgi:hypothetical protein
MALGSHYIVHIHYHVTQFGCQYSAIVGLLTILLRLFTVVFPSELNEFTVNCPFTDTLHVCSPIEASLYVTELSVHSSGPIHVICCSKYVSLTFKLTDASARPFCDNVAHYGMAEAQNFQPIS